MYERVDLIRNDRVDPIRYAWEHCNRGVSLPNVLVRSTGPAPLAASRATPIAQPASEAATLRAAVHSLIVSGTPRRAKV